MEDSPRPSTRSRPTPLHSLRFDAIGTGWQIDTARPISATLDAAINARIELFDSVYSGFRDDSLVARIAALPGVFAFPDDAAALFDVYRRLYSVTDGAMSPLVGEALARLGYDKAYSLRPTGEPALVPRWNESIAWDGRALSTVQPVSVDVGAAGKGYLVDIVGGLLAAAGIDEFVIDASGDILHSGTDPIRVGLEHPLDPTKIIGVLNLCGESLCASSSNWRAWGDELHHVVDALTGLPTTNVIATWVIAPTALEADGIATALFFADPERIAAEFRFTFVRMFSTGRAEFSPHLDGELFS